MKIIVSITTYPARINTINRCLDAMINQTVKPDKVVLYLAESQFPDKELSIDMSWYQEQGCEVRWCDEDLGPHKKYYYAMKEFPDDIIITIDDDFWYPETLVEDLMNGHKKFPKCIITRCAHLITAASNGDIAPYVEWYNRCEKYVNEPKMSLFAVGCGGILYPPKTLPMETFNKDVILKYCWHADDIWLKIMELVGNVPVVLVTKWFNDSQMQEYLQEGLYVSVNRDGGNDSQLADLLRRYNKQEDSYDTLIDRIFAEGKIYASEVKKSRYSWAEKIIDEFLIEIKKEKDILIYGAGIIAKRLYTIMCSNHYDLAYKVKAFIVSDVKENEKDINGIPVFSWQEFVHGTEKIILAMSTDKQEEICKKLEEYGVERERIIKVKNEVNRAMKTVENLEREKRKAEQVERFKIRANNCKQIVIYGAGIYGERVLRKLHEWNIYKKIVFAVTGVPEKTEIMGVDVCSIESYANAAEDILIIVAVGVALNSEMVSYLETLRIKNYIELSDELREAVKETLESFYKRTLKEQQYQCILEQMQCILKQQDSSFEKQKQHILLEKQEQSMLEQHQELLKEIYQNIHQLAERIERLENSGIHQAESKLKLDTIYDMLKRKA